MSDRVFVDTSAYYALADNDDTNHGAVVTLVQRISRDGIELFVSNFVIAETHTLILNRLGSAAATRVLSSIYAGSAHIVRATEGDETRGREIATQFADKEYSLVDAISFAIMERLHLRVAWSYDHHFQQFGFTLAH